MRTITDLDIPATEFAERRERLLQAARENGLDGLLICSRGGGALDRYGDIMYLTNHYSPFPYIPDLPNAWSGRAHSFLVLPASGDATLIVDIPTTESIQMPRNQIVVADLVVEATIKAMHEVYSNGRIGLIGGDTIPATIAKAFEEALPQVKWQAADGILTALRAIKSPKEVEKLKKASEVGSRTIEAMMNAVAAGVTHGEIVAAGMTVLVASRGILYNSFMASGRGGEKPTIVRSNFPTWGAKEPLADGEWLRLGISGVVEGYFFDLSRSRAIGSATAPQIAAFEAAIAVVNAGIAAIRPGATGGQVAAAGLKKQEEMGFAWKGVFSGLGHGIGLGWDAPWLVPDDKTELRPGMTLSVEKTLMKNGYLGDFEETVVVTDRGSELLTNARTRYW